MLIEEKEIKCKRQGKIKYQIGFATGQRAQSKTTG